MTPDILAAIASHADPDGWAAVSSRTLADELGVNQSTVARALAKHVRDGMLAVEKRHRMPARYRIQNTSSDASQDASQTHHKRITERRGSIAADPTPPTGVCGVSALETPPENASQTFASGSGVIPNWTGGTLDDYEKSDPETGHAWLAQIRDQLKNVGRGGTNNPTQLYPHNRWCRRHRTLLSQCGCPK